MKKRLIWGVMGFFLTAACAHFESMEVREQKYGKASPVIEESFASKIMRNGDTWKIYLKASDPDGDMKTIVCILEKGQRNGTDTSYISIKGENRKELSGYLIWYPGPNVDSYHEILMEIQVQDMAGHYSKPVSLALSIKPSGKQESPPPNVYQEKNLGSVMIMIRPVQGK